MRFTALLKPVRMKVTHGMYIHAAHATAGTTSTYLKNGNVVLAPGNVDTGKSSRMSPSPRPQVIWPASLYRSTSPSFFFPSRFCLSFR